jgi:hypothetical protein
MQMLGHNIVLPLREQCGLHTGIQQRSGRA